MKRGHSSARHMSSQSEFVGLVALSLSTDEHRMAGKAQGASHDGNPGWWERMEEQDGLNWPCLHQTDPASPSLPVPKLYWIQICGFTRSMERFGAEATRPLMEKSHSFLSHRHFT